MQHEGMSAVTARRQVVEWYARAESRVLPIVIGRADTMLRLAIGTVFVWFGALKLTGDSPAAALVTTTFDALGMAFREACQRSA